MNVRQFINRNPAVMAILVLIIIGVCGWVMWSQTVGSSGAKPPTAAFFTTDEGKTWFVDDVTKLAPFDKDGKQAVRVYLFQCGGAEPVAGYLQRYTAKGKDVTERYRAEQKANPGAPPKSLGEMVGLGPNATEVKKPGDGQWTPSGQAMGIVQYRCQNGELGTVVQP